MEQKPEELFAVWLRSKLFDAEKALAVFATKLSDPEVAGRAFAFRWGVDGASEAAAYLEVLPQVLSAVANIGRPETPRVSLASVRDYAEKTALRCTTWPVRSTSPGQGRADALAAGVWAEVAQFLRGELL